MRSTHFSQNGAVAEKGESNLTLAFLPLPFRSLNESGYNH
jgi:hypothetical protein